MLSAMFRQKALAATDEASRLRYIYLGRRRAERRLLRPARSRTRNGARTEAGNGGDRNHDDRYGESSNGRSDGLNESINYFLYSRLPVFEELQQNGRCRHCHGSCCGIVRDTVGYFSKLVERCVVWCGGQDNDQVVRQALKQLAQIRIVCVLLTVTEKLSHTM